MYEKLMEDSKKYQELLKTNHEQKDNSDETLKDNSDSTLKNHNDALNKSGAGVCNVIPVPPRTANVPPEATQQLSPAQFAAILTQKLEKVKRDQELNEKLSKKLSEDTRSIVSQVNIAVWRIFFLNPLADL